MSRQLLTPYKHQQDLIDRFKESNYAALFLDPGVGKTLTSINLWREACKNEGRILRALILCPPIVLQNWKNEFELCSKIDMNLVGVFPTGKPPKKKIEFAEDQTHLIKIINYEALLNEKVLDAIIKFKCDLAIADESHYLKNGKTKNFKNAYAATRSAKYRYILTGTPISNSPMDIWAQYLFMDNGLSFGRFFTNFRNKYFYDNNSGMPKNKYFPDWRLQPSMRGEMERIIRETSAKLTKEECLDLPDLVEQNIYVEPTKEMESNYNELKRELITWIENHETGTQDAVLAQNALVKLLRLNEITNGYAKTEDDEIIPFKQNPKLDALMEIIESTAPHKVIVFTIYKQTYSDISEALKKAKIKYVELHGGIAKKQDVVDQFNDLSNDIRVCIAHPRSAGVGINLKSASYAVFYSRSHSLVDREQSKARNYRAGSVDLFKKITHYDIVMNRTCDVEILNALKQKKDISNSLIAIKQAIK